MRDDATVVSGGDGPVGGRRPRVKRARGGAHRLDRLRVQRRGRTRALLRHRPDLPGLGRAAPHPALLGQKSDAAPPPEAPRLFSNAPGDPPGDPGARRRGSASRARLGRPRPRARARLDRRAADRSPSRPRAEKCPRVAVVFETDADSHTRRRRPSQESWLHARRHHQFVQDDATSGFLRSNPRDARRPTAVFFRLFIIFVPGGTAVGSPLSSTLSPPPRLTRPVRSRRRGRA